MKKDKLQKKLRKKAKKLARFAKRHGFDDLSIGAYMRFMPTVYVSYNKDGQQYHVTVRLDGDADA